MKILSIHDGHNATACYCVDGRIVSLVSEERFVNIKNAYGYPKNAVNWILSCHKLKYADFDYIAFPHLVNPHGYAHPKSDNYRHEIFSALNYLIPNFILASNKLIKPYMALFKPFRRMKIKQYCREYNIDVLKVCQVEHHLAHGYAALYASGLNKEEEPILIFTLDDSGDGISNRVALWDKQKGYQIIDQSSSFHSIGNLYANVTRYMGMKAGEHEYKIMGMAPYVSKEKAEKCIKLFLRYFNVDDNGLMRNKAKYGQAMLGVLRKDLFMQRFDTICGGIQKHFERGILKWIKTWQKRTGVKKAVFGGGCFMNVKANMLIAEMNEFEKVFFCPSCGDESLAFGAACRVAEEKGEKSIQPIDNLYLGPRFDNHTVEEALSKHKKNLVWEKCDEIEKKTAELLAQGKIIARFKGAAEWGARALGNRSILCRADDLRIVHRLNKSIKNRDFWMPFAASILADDDNKYIINPKGISASFMMSTFDTTDQAQVDIAAALHPFDKTCRPQIVKQEENPDYYDLLVHFKKNTGLSGFLNTSFNLHGYPIVGSPENAVDTLLNSELDALVIEDFIVRKKEGFQKL